jgi:hypothetical protein
VSALGALAAVAAVASVLVACGDDDDAVDTDTVTLVTAGGEPECPGPSDTITEDLADGCLLDGELVTVIQQDYGNDCVIVNWGDPDTVGAWGVLGDKPGEGSWADHSADPDFDNPCVP